MTRTHEHGQHDHGHGNEHGGHGHAGSADGAGMTGLLDLDGVVLEGYWTAALDWVRDAAGADGDAEADGGTGSDGGAGADGGAGSDGGAGAGGGAGAEVGGGASGGSGAVRVLDLGAGTGTGALGLAARFPRATVGAVDIEPESLARLAERARELGLAERVRPVQADLDAGWPDLGPLDLTPLDLTWASMSLHHMADPGAVLAAVLAATRDGGLIAVAEFPEPLRFLPDDLGLGPAGFEERVTADLGRAHAEQMPTLGSAWAPRLAAAGWQVSAERTFAIDLNGPAHPRAGEYARAWFERLSAGLGDRLDAADQATLAALLDPQGPHSLLHRTDLHIRGTRTVTLGRRG